MLIVAVGGDAGGASAVAPVIEALTKDGETMVRALAYRQAGDVWTQFGLTHETIDEDLSRGAAADILRHAGASLLLTGTSMNAAMLEMRFVEAARDLGIPSIAVLDSWVNYRERFVVEGDRPCLPDRIAVMDERARAEMIAEGFDSSILVVTGQPAFDDLARCRAAFSAEKRDRLRADLGVDAPDLLVLFVSQPLSDLYGSDDIDSRHRGFNEYSVLSELIRALECIARSSSRSIVLLVRPHPREDDVRLRAVTSDAVRIIVTRDGGPRELALAADLVTGMHSALLLEACYLHCITVSLQPGLRGVDILPSNRIGLSRPVYTVCDILPAVERLLLDESARAEVQIRLRSSTPAQNATACVAQLVHHTLRSADRG